MISSAYHILIGDRKNFAFTVDKYGDLTSLHFNQKFCKEPSGLNELKSLNFSEFVFGLSDEPSLLGKKLKGLDPRTQTSLNNIAFGGSRAGLLTQKPT